LKEALEVEVSAQEISQNDRGKRENYQYVENDAHVGVSCAKG